MDSTASLVDIHLCVARISKPKRFFPALLIASWADTSPLPKDRSSEADCALFTAREADSGARVIVVVVVGLLFRRRPPFRRLRLDRSRGKTPLMEN